GSFLNHYLPPPTPPASGATVEDAVAGAAFTVLTNIYPSQSAFFLTQLQLHGNLGSPGHDFGVDIARQILTRRAADPSASAGTHMRTNGRGRHDVDPDNSTQGFHGPNYGSALLFATKTRFTLNAPPFNNGADAKYK